MNMTFPIQNKKEINIIKMYLKSKSIRDYLLFVLGINTNLRISDIIDLKVEDVWDNKKVKDYITLNEKKTKKYRKIRINDSLGKAISEFVKSEKPEPYDYLFASRKGGGHISRQQACNILSQAGDFCGLKEPLSPHSLRKTWGYWAYKSGVSLLLIMDALNHSSLAITKKYLGITQDEIDDVFINLNL